MDKKKKDNDCYAIITDTICNLNLKIGFILFLVYFVINTDYFCENVLYHVDKSSYDIHKMTLSNRGFIINGLILICIYLMVDLASQNEII